MRSIGTSKAYDAGPLVDAQRRVPAYPQTAQSPGEEVTRAHRAGSARKLRGHFLWHRLTHLV
jgi:hypothetical protein